MALETFNWAVQAGVSTTAEFKTRVVSLGDGYEQRASNGINNLLREFSVVFKGVWGIKDKTKQTKFDFQLVEEFLQRHRGYKAFSWTSYLQPNNTAIKVYCPSYTKTNDQGVVTITMTFKETL